MICGCRKVGGGRFEESELRGGAELEQVLDEVVGGVADVVHGCVETLQLACTGTTEGNHAPDQ